VRHPLVEAVEFLLKQFHGSGEAAEAAAAHLAALEAHLRDEDARDAKWKEWQGRMGRQGVDPCADAPLPPVVEPEPVKAEA
jgi:hypothetical protein